MLRNHFQVVSSNYIRLVSHIQHLRYIDGCSDHYHVAVDGFNGCLQVLNLFLSVSHCREDVGQMAELFKDLDKATLGGWTRIHNFFRIQGLCQGKSGATGETTMGQSWSVIDHQYSFAFHHVGCLIRGKIQSCLFVFGLRNNLGLSKDNRDVVRLENGLFTKLFCMLFSFIERRQLVHFGNENGITQANVGFSGKVMQFVGGTQGIDQRNGQIWLVETAIIVATIPKNKVGVLLGLAKDHFVIDTCK
mmetsp:Transcript_6034/g.11204  ORF Transcript_6034/g.11204 Transcript_6034/m.11204 type:complete len:247 (-) Transcript_6034:763-1503(-)